MNKEQLKNIAQKSITDFIRVEDGKLGKRNALMLSSTIGATVLGQTLLDMANDAEATGLGGDHTQYSHSQASIQ